MHQWKERTRPVRLERRFEFESYEATRNFLDELGKLCESLKRYPDISFGKTYVNLTLASGNEGETDEISNDDKKLASKIDQICQ
nr:4a-hydroxytetrahydrobiopterin dehydratase [Prochlorococcus marinus]